MLEELVRNLMKALDTKDQGKINKEAIALAKYLYKPDSGVTYEEILEGCCYRKEEKDNGISKQK